MSKRRWLYGVDYNIQSFIKTKHAGFAAISFGVLPRAIIDFETQENQVPLGGVFSVVDPTALVEKSDLLQERNTLVVEVYENRSNGCQLCYKVEVFIF